MDKAEIGKILCIACNDCTDHPADCQMVSNQAQFITALIIKWLESKKQEVLGNFPLYKSEQIIGRNQLITELIGEVR